MRDFIVNHYPLDPGRVILGHAVHRPRRISLSEASRRLRIRQVRVRSLCAAAGIVVREDRASLGEGDFQDFLEYVGRFATYKETISYIGCGPSLWLRLREVCLISQSKMEKGTRRFLWSDVRGFTKPTEDLPLSRETARLRSFWKTCSQLNCTVVDVYEMIQSGLVMTAARSFGPTHFTALLMDPKEIRDHPVPGTPRDPHLTEAAIKLRPDGYTIHYLAKHGFLKIRKLRHPSSRNMRWYVDRHSLEQFLAKHITIGLLAKALNTVAGLPVNHLNKMQIEPVIAAFRISRIHDRDVVQARLAVPSDFGARFLWPLASEFFSDGLARKPPLDTRR
ncbi:hypothetical protein [Palleronia sp. LCG004]|uniref:hypothetical protein n=1 Tax=Palleronia sp. LCG004 TaxID=3079304 RepID=UPI002941D50E|nr:hypothetical protein [Palleronia sp. LCG004]WOI57885.1 hypothetical protein RVY76_14845 [Palleronia sp. LCG004]